MHYCCAGDFQPLRQRLCDVSEAGPFALVGGTGRQHMHDTTNQPRYALGRQVPSHGGH